MQSLNELEGKTLAGTYPLGRLLRREGDVAWFATHLQNKPATIFVAEGSQDEDQLIAGLEAVSRVKHANVVGIDKVGRARLDGSSIVYAIEEATEENLAEVLRERPLTADETTQIIESLIAGLTVLHEHGLVNGHISAANIFAIGDTVKLRSDCVQKLTPAQRSNPEAYDQDVGDMGALIFEALTQRRLTSPDEPAIAKLPVPFRAIVQSAVTGRWGLTDIATALRKPSLAANHPVPATTEASKAAPPKAAILNPPVIESTQRPTGQPSKTQPRSKNVGVRILAILAMVAALGIFYYFNRISHHAPTLAQDQTLAQTPAQVQGQVSDASSAPAQPAAPVSQAAPADTEASSAPSADGDHKIWRVVVYTYAYEAEAEKKAAAIVKAHPDWKPETFSPNGHGPYLVTVGGPMDRKAAFRFREKAVAEGLPSDSYAQNYSH
jgi:hypothetical protein